MTRFVELGSGISFISNIMVTQTYVKNVPFLAS